MAEETKKDVDRLSTFKKAYDGMVDVTDSTYVGRGWQDDYRGRQFREPLKDYSEEEIKRIVNSGSLLQKKKLSQNYFNKNGFYFMTCMYYATLLKYIGVLIPNPKQDQKLDSPYMSKRYYDAMNTIEAMKLPGLLTKWALKSIVNGCYFGVIASKSKDEFIVLDLPAAYCANNYKDLKGNNIVEFNLSYFDSIGNKQTRKQVLKTYPDFINAGYRKWKDGKGPQWIFLPSDSTICFPFIEGEGRPPFLSVILQSLNYDEAVDTELDRAAEEIKKILIQKVPHNSSTNELVFEPDEALEMHRGTVNMLKKNPNVDVITTYADVDAVTMKTTADTAASTIEALAESVYYEAGVSGKLFGVDTATGMDKNVKVSIAIMMNLADRFSSLITNIINELYKNSNISFTYKILPISYQNDKEYLDDAFKIASSGYSLIVPALALGLSQRDLSNLKELENDVLRLPETLVPLSSAFTASSTSTDPEAKDTTDQGGAPKKEEDDKSPETIKTEISKSSES